MLVLGIHFVADQDRKGRGTQGRGRPMHEKASKTTP